MDSEKKRLRDMVDMTIRKTGLNTELKEIWRDRQEYCLSCSKTMEEKKRELWITQEEIEQCKCGRIHQTKRINEIVRRKQ